MQRAKVSCSARLAHRVQGAEIGVLPGAAAATAVEDGGVIIREAGRLLVPRPRRFERGERLLDPAGGEKTAINLDSPVRKAPFVSRHQRDEGVDITLPIHDVLQGSSCSVGAPITHLRLPIGRYLLQPPLQVCPPPRREPQM